MLRSSEPGPLPLLAHTEKHSETELMKRDLGFLNVKRMCQASEIRLQT